MSSSILTPPEEQGFFQKMADMLAKVSYELVSSTGGSGVSSTKVVWLSNGMLLCYCAALATIGGVSVYLFFQVANAVYWAAVSALWTVSTGFAVSAKKHQNLTRKGILNANLQTQNSGTPNQGGAS